MKILLNFVIILFALTLSVGDRNSSNLYFHDEILKQNSNVFNSETIVVGVIDTGLKYSEYSRNVKLCKFGHKDFTSIGHYHSLPNVVDPVPADEHGHGTNVLGLITKYAEDTNYCIVVLKFYSPSAVGDDFLINEVRAIKYATAIKIKYLN